MWVTQTVLALSTLAEARACVTECFCALKSSQSLESLSPVFALHAQGVHVCSRGSSFSSSLPLSDRTRSEEALRFLAVRQVTENRFQSRGLFDFALALLWNMNAYFILVH